MTNLKEQNKINLKFILLILLLIILFIASILSITNVIKMYIGFIINFSAIVCFVIIKLITKKIENKKILKESQIYKTFKNGEEVEAWAKDYYGEPHLKKLKSYYSKNSDDPYGIGWYKGNLFYRFNDFPDSISSRILNNYINTFTLNENFIAYRFCCQEEYEELYKRKKVFVNRFLSTTLFPESFNGKNITKENLIKIIIPKNTPGLYLPNKSPIDLEFEILLPSKLYLIYVGKSNYNNQKIKTYIIENPRLQTLKNIENQI